MRAIRPITDPEYAAWVAQAIPAYAKEKVVSGAWAEADAIELAMEQFQTLLPRGKDTKENFIYSVVGDDGAQVGILWFAVQDRGSTRIAYVYDIAVFPEHRRKGHAQRAFQALEHEAKGMGLEGVALHVFGHNTSAQALYAKLGYSPTNVNMYKALRGDGG